MEDLTYFDLLDTALIEEILKHQYVKSSDIKSYCIDCRNFIYYIENSAASLVRYEICLNVTGYEYTHVDIENTDTFSIQRRKLSRCPHILKKEIEQQNQNGDATMESTS